MARGDRFILRTLGGVAAAAALAGGLGPYIMVSFYIVISLKAAI